MKRSNSNCDGGKRRGIITNLPQPTANATRPERVTVLAQAAGNMVSRSSADDAAARLMQNGVRTIPIPFDVCFASNTIRVTPSSCQICQTCRLTTL
jgi:hypothetical protein